MMMMIMIMMMMLMMMLMMINDGTLKQKNDGRNETMIERRNDIVGKESGNGMVGFQGLNGSFTPAFKTTCSSKTGFLFIYDKCFMAVACPWINKKPISCSFGGKP